MEFCLRLNGGRFSIPQQELESIYQKLETHKRIHGETLWISADANGTIHYYDQKPRFNYQDDHWMSCNFTMGNVFYSIGPIRNASYACARFVTSALMADIYEAMNAIEDDPVQIAPGVLTESQVAVIVSEWCKTFNLDQVKIKAML